jgi:hypothetical protein
VAHAKLKEHNRWTLIDIGLVVEKLMGGAYESQYTSRQFKLRYAQCQRKLDGDAVRCFSKLVKCLKSIHSWCIMSGIT